jgi:integrase
VTDPKPTRVALTDKFLKALEPGATARDIWDAEQPGLMARVLPSGRIEFAVRYRAFDQRANKRKRRRLKLGVYPDVTLAMARKRARAARSEIDDRRDPVAERAAAATPKTDTIEQLVTDYLKRHARPKKRTAAEDERVLDRDVLTYWRTRSTRSITRRDVRQLVERVVDRGSPIMANRLLALVRKLLNFAVDHDWIEANPAARIAKPAPEQSRDRVLTDDELRRIWRLLSNLPTTADKPAPGRPSRRRRNSADPLCPVSAPLAALLKVRLLTAQRGGEVMCMRWSDVDLKSGWWTIPAAAAKNGQSHRVPLTPDVVAIIKEQMKPLDDDAPARSRSQDENGHFVFVGHGASLRDRAKKAPAAIASALGIEFRGHDFRRTAATRMAAAGIPREHIAFVLNHVDGAARATRVYDRYDRDSEKRTAIESWGRTLQAILDGDHAGAKVLPMQRRRLP